MAKEKQEKNQRRFAPTAIVVLLLVIVALLVVLIFRLPLGRAPNGKPSQAGNQSSGANLSFLPDTTWYTIVPSGDPWILDLNFSQPGQADDAPNAVAHATMNECEPASQLYTQYAAGYATTDGSNLHVFVEVSVDNPYAKWTFDGPNPSQSAWTSNGTKNYVGNNTSFNSLSWTQGTDPACSP